MSDSKKPPKKKAPAKPRAKAKPKAEPFPTDPQGETNAGTEDTAATELAPLPPVDAFPTATPSETETGSQDSGTDGVTSRQSGDAGKTPLAAADAADKNLGDNRIPSVADGQNGDPAIPESLRLARERLPGETKSACKERLRMLARNAGLPRGVGPGTAYEWAMHAVLELFAPVPEPAEDAKTLEDSTIPFVPQWDKLPVSGESEEHPTVVPVAPAPSSNDGSVSGLADLPEGWPTLPANAQLQVEIAWVSANRLRVRSGNGVDLSRALSPAPSYSALSWLETSILFPSKFADISVKATAQQDDEREGIRREKLAIEEIRSLLAEMLDG